MQKGVATKLQTGTFDLRRNRRVLPVVHATVLVHVPVVNINLFLTKLLVTAKNAELNRLNYCDSAHEHAHERHPKFVSWTHVPIRTPLLTHVFMTTVRAYMGCLSTQHGTRVLYKLWYYRWIVLSYSSTM